MLEELKKDDSDRALVALMAAIIYGASSLDFYKSIDDAYGLLEAVSAESREDIRKKAEEE